MLVDSKVLFSKKITQLFPAFRIWKLDFEQKNYLERKFLKFKILRVTIGLFQPFQNNSNDGFFMTHNLFIELENDFDVISSKKPLILFDCRR